MAEYRKQDGKSKSDAILFLEKRKDAPVNSLMIFLNILVFLFTELTGSSLDSLHLVKCGAAYTPLIVTEHEYYRLFTCMFLHFGLTHLGNNMLVLLFLGDSLEKEVGKLRYLLIYLIGGVGASCVSCYMEIRKGSVAVSAGASGAVFAVIGALLYVVLRNKGQQGDFSSRQILFLAALTLYHGVTSAGVDNAAHAGGFVCGFLLGIILCRRRKELP